MRVERPLVRLNYVEAPEYLHDPALPMPPVPVLSAVDAFLNARQEREKCAALAELRRRLNRVLAELDECGEAAAELLSACSGRKRASAVDIPERRE